MMTVLRKALLLLGLQLLTARTGNTLRHEPHWHKPTVRPKDGHSWDLLAAMQDKPAGAYHALMGPAAEAMMLSYGLSQGPFHNKSLKANATITCEGCGTWVPMLDLHADPQVGVHAFVFANNKSKQVIVAFRGACFYDNKQTCRGDICFMLKHRTFGPVTELVFLGNEITHHCYMMDGRKLDYEGQALDIVTRVKAQLPGFNIVLVGHSLGGFLADYVAVAMPEVQAIAFDALTIGRDLENEGVPVEVLDKRANSSNIVTLCDPYDCAMKSLAEHDARRGTVSCFYDEWSVDQVPKSCMGMRAMALDGVMDGFEWARAMNCVPDSHSYWRYSNITHWPSKGDASKPLLPTCSSSLSVLSSKVTESIRYAQGMMKIGGKSAVVNEI